MKRILLVVFLCLLAPVMQAKEPPLQKFIDYCNKGDSLSCFSAAERLYKSPAKWSKVKPYSKKACFIELEKSLKNSLAEVFCWSYMEKLSHQEPDNDSELLEITRKTCDHDPSNIYMCYRAGLLLEKSPKYKNSSALIDRYWDRACYQGKARSDRERTWRDKACKKLQ